MTAAPLLRCPLGPHEPRGADVATAIFLIGGPATRVARDLRAMARRWCLGDGRALAILAPVGRIDPAACRALWRAAADAERRGVYCATTRPEWFRQPGK